MWIKIIDKEYLKGGRKIKYIKDNVEKHGFFIKRNGIIYLMKGNPFYSIKYKDYDIYCETPEYLSNEEQMKQFLVDIIIQCIKIEKERLKEIKRREKYKKRLTKMCKTIIYNTIKTIFEEKEKNLYFLLDGYLENHIKSDDIVYCRYRKFTYLIEIYPIDWNFLKQVEKIKQKIPQIPPKSGIYILECGKYIYIGQSFNLLRRLIQHYIGLGSICTRNNEITKIKRFFPWRVIDRKHIEMIENGFIKTYKRFYSPELINPINFNEK
jgi:predicted GIY-YIG superfamily endonuclease